MKVKFKSIDNSTVSLFISGGICDWISNRIMIELVWIDWPLYQSMVVIIDSIGIQTRNEQRNRKRIRRSWIGEEHCSIHNIVIWNWIGSNYNMSYKNGNADDNDPPLIPPFYVSNFTVSSSAPISSLFFYTFIQRQRYNQWTKSPSRIHWIPFNDIRRCFLP